MNLKYTELRKKYPIFSYNAYKINKSDENIIIEYEFEIEGLIKFRPKLLIPIKNIKENDLNNPIITNLVFNIGVMETINYLKATCSQNLIIKCGYLDEFQKEWFKKLFFDGLGEFFYRNDIQNNLDNFLEIKTLGNQINLSNVKTKKLKGQLIPVGGGKDSNVSMEILRSLKNENIPFILNARGATLESVRVAGYEGKTIIANRILAPEILELNKKGFLNGHTPFSALLAFVTNLVAYLEGLQYVVLSNESSANEPNVKGTNINHQYSKSFEFENDFRDYEKKYLKTGVEYFSLLRPLTEVEIAGLFANYKKYHFIFKSCNVGSKENKWCCNCSKCLFVYIMLSQFLSQEEMISIFGENLLDKLSLKDTFIGLIGNGNNKPFDCVGTYKEVNYSLCKIIEKILKNNKKMPLLLEKYFKEECNSDLSIVNNEINNNNELLHYFGENDIPYKFIILLKNELRLL